MNLIDLYMKITFIDLFIKYFVTRQHSTEINKDALVPLKKHTHTQEI